jgi:hypothetical protein
LSRQEYANIDKTLELRAAMSLALLWRDQARCSKLANCWLRFAEGFDTHDLKEAKALLEELAA